MTAQANAKCFLSQRLLGSEAVYELLEEGEETVTVVVVRAPGLTAGSQLRLMTRATRAMERVDGLVSPVAEAADFVAPLAA